jgi:hypothetical protein
VLEWYHRLVPSDRPTKRSPFGRYDSGSTAARGLALVPIAMAILLVLLQMPRACPPDFLPVPDVDVRTLAAVVAKDRARADRARREPLPYEVREVGSAIRDLFGAQARAEQKSDAEINELRQRIDTKLHAALEGGPEGMLGLRALQLDSFLSQVAAFEATGKPSSELEALGGNFVAHMKEAGWTRGNAVLLDEDERRVAFKIAWNTAANLDTSPAFQLTLDETRVLYRLFLTRPHPTERERAMLVSLRSSAASAKQCADIAVRERASTEAWRLDKVRKLAALDPSYPGGYALGVEYYRTGDFRRAQEEWQGYLKDHPNGPWSIRARNHLKAALVAGDM